MTTRDWYDSNSVYLQYFKSHRSLKNAGRQNTKSTSSISIFSTKTKETYHPPLVFNNANVSQSSS